MVTAATKAGSAMALFGMCNLVHVLSPRRFDRQLKIYCSLHACSLVCVACVTFSWPAAFSMCLQKASQSINLSISPSQNSAGVCDSLWHVYVSGSVWVHGRRVWQLLCLAAWQAINLKSNFGVTWHDLWHVAAVAWPWPSACLSHLQLHCA